MSLALEQAGQLSGDKIVELGGREYEQSTPLTVPSNTRLVGTVGSQLTFDLTVCTILFVETVLPLVK